MSIFKFDDGTTRMIHYLLAIQRFKEYQIGPSDLTPQLCAISFEKMLIQTALMYPKFQKAKPHNISLDEIIRFLQRNNYISQAVGGQLQEYLMFRNAILTGVDISPDKATEMLQFLCSHANIASNKEIPNKSFHAIVNRKINASTIDAKLVESDFDNLDALYPKCYLIQHEIQKRLRSPLRAVQPSAFAPNTGGIWLPFIKQNEHGYREPTDTASLGVAFSPLGIRIGLNFGCHAHNARIRYYETLSNGEFADILNSLNRKATGYCLCDTFWNFHIRNIQSLQWCLTLYGSTKVTIERAIEETNQQKEISLTSHRYLVSKIIERRPEDFTYIIQGIVNEIPKVLDELYPVLEKVNNS